MTDVPSRIVEELINDVNCPECDTDFEYNIGPDSVSLPLEFQFVCDGCDREYNVLIEDWGDKITVDAKVLRGSQDEVGGMLWTGSPKPILQANTHPIRWVVEDISELFYAMQILKVNHLRFADKFEELTEQGIRQGARFYSTLRADIHNYLASAYSYSQIKNTIKSDFELDDSLKEAMELFNEKERPVIGLRHFAQHHRALLESPSHLGGEIEETLTIDIDLDRLYEYDYECDPDCYFGHIDGEPLDVKNEIDDHMSAVDVLTQEIFQYINREYGDELDEFERLTSFSHYRDEERIKEI